MALTPLEKLLTARIQVWNATHPANLRIDPRAELGIAAHEGLSGGIGDNGTSFGPNQLHIGGAYPAFAPHGTPQQDEAWASSPAGIDYTLGRIASVAGGLHGLPAITAISTRFERPANPTAEIQDAAAHYGLPMPNLTGYGATDAPQPQRRIPSQTLAPQQPSMSPGLLASLMSNSQSQPVTITPPNISFTQAAPPLQTLMQPTPHIPFQPLLVGGH